MKSYKFFLSVIALIFLFESGINAQAPYYYYNGEKQYFNLDKSRLFVSVADTSQLNEVLDIQKAKFKRDIPVNRQVRKEYSKRYWMELSLPDSLSENQYQSKIALIKQNNNAVIAPYFVNRSGKKTGLSNFLYVKLKTLNDTIILKQQALNYSATIVCQDEFMPLWFVVSVTPASNYNAMELANVFYESDLFQSAEPDFIVENLLACTNDAYFNDQWGLKNTGQHDGTAGIDIKMCDAWQISTGSNVIVAVLDEGIELNHPDLAANIYSQSYDTENGTSPSIVRGNHGTACAGIAGAISNNNAGIAGVAPNSTLISISNSLSLTPLIRQQLADGINWAWQHGADVISNSWAHPDLAGNYITDAVNNATSQGRNGLGCVLAFCTQNWNDSVAYPATLPNVIAVGAITPTGSRASFSNYGSELDVVAPGVYVPTTDRQGDNGYNYSSKPNDYSNRDYTQRFDGTSAATPHVAGIAALVLSVNPSLTGQQVRNIIESTAQKVGGYNYQTTSGHPNGTWNNEMGYGLVNAYAAVQTACPTVNFTNRTVTSNTTVSGCNIYVQNVTVTGGAKLTLNATGSTHIGSNVNVELGSQLEIK
ncbi:MAG: S8 family serine peptidase [Dysgonamonadaceae bacterium]|jgi:subtilisin family serine protease|nr:S8 family serine peptidase [Dysgonamonadaceae bacterium]